MEYPSMIKKLLRYVDEKKNNHFLFNDLFWKELSTTFSKEEFVYFKKEYDNNASLRKNLKDEFLAYFQHVSDLETKLYEKLSK
jgi:hypothetical protein